MPAGSPLQRIEDVDRAGVRIASGKNAYDLYLSRTLKHAQLVHAPSSPGAIELFVSEKLDATAGVKQQLLAFAKTHRMCTGRFHGHRANDGDAQSRDVGARYLRAFLEEAVTNPATSAASA